MSNFWNIAIAHWLVYFIEYVLLLMLINGDINDLAKFISYFYAIDDRYEDIRSNNKKLNWNILMQIVNVIHVKCC